MIPMIAIRRWVGEMARGSVDTPLGIQDSSSTAAETCTSTIDIVGLSAHKTTAPSAILPPNLHFDRSKAAGIRRLSALGPPRQTRSVFNCGLGAFCCWTRRPHFDLDFSHLRRQTPHRSVRTTRKWREGGVSPTSCLRSWVKSIPWVASGKSARSPETRPLHDYSRHHDYNESLTSSEPP